MTNPVASATGFCVDHSAVLFPFRVLLRHALTRRPRILRPGGRAMAELETFLATHAAMHRDVVADDLDPILRALARIVLHSAPGAGSYLIIECEDVYVQFCGTYGDTTLQ